jgi:hypothetical protein
LQFIFLKKREARIRVNWKLTTNYNLGE